MVDLGRSGPPCFKPEKCKKNLSHIKFIAITEAKPTFCSALTVKYLVWMLGCGKNEHLFQKKFFCKCRRIKLKLCDFLIYNLTACNVVKKGWNFIISHRPQRQSAHLRCQFDHVLHRQFLYHMLKASIFAKVGLKLTYFCKKIAKSPSAGGFAPRPPSLRRLAALPPKACCGWICSYLIDSSLLFFGIYATF